MSNRAEQFGNNAALLDHNRLLSLINSLSDGFIATDNEGRIELSNSVALNILNTNSLNDKNIADVMPLLSQDGNQVGVLSLASHAAQAFVSRDYKLRYPDNTAITLYISISPVRAVYGASQAGFVVFFRDITAEKNAEGERDEFISVASHELRTPIAIAEGSLSNAKLLAERTGVSDTVLQTIKTAHEQIIFLSNLDTGKEIEAIKKLNFEYMTKSNLDPGQFVKKIQTLLL